METRILKSKEDLSTQIFDEVEFSAENGATLEQLVFKGCIFRRCKFINLHFAASSFSGAKFQDCSIRHSEFRSGTDLSNCVFTDASVIEKTTFEDSPMEGVFFKDSTIERSAIRSCSGAVSFRDVRIDRVTLISSVSIDRDHSDTHSLNLVLRNVRMNRWSEWYRTHRIYAPLLKCFWAMTDYGASTGRLVLVLGALILLFQQAYLWPVYSNAPPMITGLSSGDGDIWMLQLKSLYFTAVTASTVGYGDMHAVENARRGYALVTLNIAAGYLGFGLFVARLSALMQE